jgi:uncharacterized membrane protein/protein-disulfide isomerase
MKKNKETKPLPFPVYFWTIAFIAFAGIADSIYLSISHYRVYTDMGYSSFCAISRAINCDTVSQSPYSIFLGVPVAAWGVMGYVFFLLFLPFAWNKEAQKKRIWSILFFVSLAFSIYSIILAFISTFYIHSYCIMCLLSYGISFMLLYYTWFIRRKFDKSSLIVGLKGDIGFLWKIRKKVFSAFFPYISFILILFIFFPAYWNLKPPLQSEDIPSGITEEGYPWLGAESPELTITEFTDYQCFQCKKMHFFLRQLVANYPNKIRLIHRHFPLDHEYNPIIKKPFHVGSGAMSIFAQYAQTQNKFWKMNDTLFDIAGKKGRIDIKELAGFVGLDHIALAASIQNKIMRYKVKHDISVGIKLGINGTPAYVIKDQVYLGQIPPKIIKDILD